MAKQTLSQDTQRSQQMHADHQRMKEIYQGAYDAYQALGLQKQLVSIDDLIFPQPEAQIRELMFEENNTLKTLPLKKESVLAMIELGPGFDTFARWANNVIASSGRHSVNTALFSIVGGVVTLSPALNQYVADQTSLYATTAEESLLSEAQALFTQLQAFQQAHPKLRVLPNSDTGSITLFSNLNGQIRMQGIAVRQTQ